MSSKRLSFGTAVIRVLIGAVLSLLLYLFLKHAGTQHHAKTVVNVYAYPDMLSAEVFQDFTRETGIAVHVKYFEEIEDVLTKLSFGGDDIDLVTPTGAMVEVLRQKGLVRELDQTVLQTDLIDSRLMAQFYDPENTYSVPFNWSPLGVCYDTRLISVPRDQIGWDIMFGVRDGAVVHAPSARYGHALDRVCMGEDQWEALNLAALHLYGTTQNLSDEQLTACAQLLRIQKRGWLECYTNNLKYFLISQITPAVVSPGAYAVQMKEQYPWVEFVVPARGSLVFIGSLVIPRSAKNIAAVYRVINYLLSVSGGLACFEQHAYNPSNRLAYEKLPAYVRTHPYLLPQDDIFERLHIEHNQFALKKVEELWQHIKR